MPSNQPPSSGGSSALTFTGSTEKLTCQTWLGMSVSSRQAWAQTHVNLSSNLTVGDAVSRITQQCGVLRDNVPAELDKTDVRQAT
jgi:hypothetical protein